MADKTLKYISTKMKNIDLCMMTTIGSRGAIVARPMSNNGDVKYDGNSYFFTYSDTGKVKDIKADPTVGLSFTTKDYMFIHVSGKASLIKDKATMEEHWVPSLNQWFKDGVNTAGIVMLLVKAKKIKYWHKMDEGEITL